MKILRIIFLDFLCIFLIFCSFALLLENSLSHLLNEENERNIPYSFIFVLIILAKLRYNYTRNFLRNGVLVNAKVSYLRKGFLRYDYSTLTFNLNGKDFEIRGTVGPEVSDDNTVYLIVSKTNEKKFLPLSLEDVELLKEYIQKND